MYSKMMLPIQLTKILYSDWKGTIAISSQDSQIYGKCLNGPGQVTFKNGNKYIGQFHNGLLSGKGKFIWANGIIYEGQFTNNRITGEGSYSWPDGSSYEGQVKDGLRDGYGVYKVDDATYQGQWRQGKKEGKGKIIFKSGSIFEGSFKDDLKDGFGKMYYYPSGNYFEGEWKNDLKEGQGIMNWTDLREKYFGEWHKNFQHGWGVHIWLESKGEGKYLRNRYEGNWANGVREGFGTFYYANGSKYQGYWEKNMKQGFAFYTNQNGKVSHMKFDKDRMLRSGQQPKFQQNSKKVSSKKEVEPNSYSQCLQIDHFYSPLVINLEGLYNLLLRNNTQLKYWYKGLSNFYDQQSEYSFCLNLEGVWKMVRTLKVLGDLSLSEMNRGLRENNPVIEQLLKMIDFHSDQVIFQQIYYHEQVRKVEQLNVNKIDMSNFLDIDLPFSQCIVHNRNKNIMFRQFVHLLAWLANSLYPGSSKPQKGVEAILAKVTPMLQNISKSIKLGTSDNISQNLSSVSKAQKNISLHFRTVNKQLMEFLKSEEPSKKRIKQNDLTIKIRQIMGIGRKAGVFNQAEFLLFERIMDKYMDPEVLTRGLSENVSNTNLSKKVINIMNYELIEYQFTQLIYFLLIKKLPNHKQTEQNKAKYAEFCTVLKEESNKIKKQNEEQAEYENEQRILISKKSVQKKKMAEKRKKMEMKKNQEMEKQKRIEREEYERKLMEQEDKDVKEEQFQDQESELQF